MLRRLDQRNRVTGWLWCAAFLACAVAAIAGGTGHGFAPDFDADTLDMLWNIVPFAIGASAALMASAIHAADVRRGDGTVQWLLVGIVVTVVGLAIQHTGFSAGAYFNHNDAYHLIQIPGIWSLYRCAQTVRDRGMHEGSGTGIRV
jgi:hypothetical protein